MRIPRPGDRPAGDDWQDGRCDCRTRAEHDRVCFQSDPVEARKRNYFAAVHTDRLMQSTEAVMRLADEEMGALLGRITGATDDELARRLEWATGRNGHTLLAQIRAEGLDVMTVRPEQANA